MIVLPICLQMVLEYDALQAGLSIAPLSLSMFGVALPAGRRAGRRRPSTLPRAGFASSPAGCYSSSARAARRLGLVAPGAAGDRRAGLGLLGLAAEQLHRQPGLRRARQRGRRGQLGGGLLRARLRRRDHADRLATAFTTTAGNSEVLSPSEQQRVAEVLETDAQQTRSSASTPTRPVALQVALLVPMLAGLLGLANSWRMAKLPDPVGSGFTEGLALG